MPEPTAPISMRKALRWLHLWLGLILCVPLVLLGMTGTILTFQHSFDRPAAQSAGQAQSVAAIIAAATKVAPADQVPASFAAPVQPGGAATVRFSPPGRGGPGLGTQVAVDPVSLAIMDVSEAGGVMRMVHQLHANLLIDGRGIVGWLGVVMLAMGVSGLVIWWPRPGRWRAALSVSRAARGVRLHRELHGAVGIWGLLVLVTVSVTGVYLAFPETMAGLIGVEARPSTPPKVAAVKDAIPIDADGAIVLALAAAPGGVLKTVALPNRPDQPFRVNLAHRDAADGAPAVTAFVDPWRAQVIEIRDPGAGPLTTQFAAWQRAIHSGLGLGQIWHLLVGLSGLLPLLFAVTGIAMWALKRQARRRIAARAAPLAEAAE